MAEVDARKAGAPYSRQSKGRKDKDGGPAVIKPEAFQTRIQNLIDLKVKAMQAVKAYQEASTAVAEAAGLYTGTVNRYVRSRINNSFLEDRNRVSQMAFVFENFNELGEYAPIRPAPAPEAAPLTNEPEQNPIEKRAANDEGTGSAPPPTADDDDDEAHPGNPAPSPAARAGGRSRGR